MLLNDMINMQSVITFNALAKFPRSCKIDLFFLQSKIFDICMSYEYMSRYFWASTGCMTHEVMSIHI